MTATGTVRSAWTDDVVQSHERTGRFRAYLGSWPVTRSGWTEGEQSRYDFLSRTADRKGCRIYQIHTKEREYFFVEAKAGHKYMDDDVVSYQAVDHRANVDAMKFGELDTSDSDDFACRIPWMHSGYREWAIPIEAVSQPSRMMLPEPGTQYGHCLEACEHPMCRWARGVAGSACEGCKDPIGYGREFVEGALKSDVWGDPPRHAHEGCRADNLGLLYLDAQNLWRKSIKQRMADMGMKPVAEDPAVDLAVEVAA